MHELLNEQSAALLVLLFFHGYTAGEIEGTKLHLLSLYVSQKTKENMQKLTRCLAFRELVRVIFLRAKSWNASS